MSQGTIFKIKRYALHDGPGIRTTVFLKGCPLSCPWCHNPEGQRPDIETIRKSAGRNKSGHEREPVGWKVTTQELIAEIEKDRIFFDTSGGGVTFSGGEPLMQADFLTELLINCRKIGIHTAVDTSGFAPLEKLKRVAEVTDLFLFDVKVVNPEAHLRLTHCSNQSIIANLKWLDQSGKKVIVRFPLIPGVTDDVANIEAVAELLARLPSLRQVDVLPFHRVGSGKYHRLDRPDPLAATDPLAPEVVQEVRQQFENYGLRAGIGG